MKLWLDRMIFPVTALGPGNRLCLWVAGCGRKCPGCANPELWTRQDRQAVETEKLAQYMNRLLRGKNVDGITVTGGEPFDQAEALSALFSALENPPEDLLVFTGYRLEELRGDREKEALLKRTAVLVDGPYIREKNDGTSPLRGSANQRIHYLHPSLEAVYLPYLEKGRQIQNVVYDYQIISVGIHNESGRS